MKVFINNHDCTHLQPQDGQTTAWGPHAACWFFKLSLWTEINCINSQSVSYKIAVFPQWIQCFQSLYISLHTLREHVTNKGVECSIIKVEFTKSTSAKFSPRTKYDSCLKNVNICKLRLFVMRSLDLFNWNFHFLNCGKKMRLSQELTVHNQLCSECLRHTFIQTFHCRDLVKGLIWFMDVQFLILCY